MHKSCFLGISVLLLFFGSKLTLADHLNVTYSGNIDYVLIDDGSGVLSGTGVGEPITGSFSYGQNASDAVITPDSTGETDYLFSSSPYSSQLTSGGKSVGTNDAIIVISNDNPIGINPPDETGLSELSILAGFTISQGDPFDGWTARSESGNLGYGFTTFSFKDLTLTSDESFVPVPPATGDVTAFYVEETDDNGDVIYFALGAVEKLAVRVVPIPETTYRASGWHATNFMTLGVPTRAIAFDSNSNLYIENIGDDNSGIIEVQQLTAASGYQTFSRYVSYPTDYKGATGLGFDRLGNLYVAERDDYGDAGIIRVIDVAAQKLTGDVMAFANHRPTGVDADTSGNLFYSGRKESAGIWGKIFRIDTNPSAAVRTELLKQTVATGIAVDQSGDIYISTPQREDLPLQSNSIYRFAVNNLLNPELIATFDVAGGELTFDADGNLYMVTDDKFNIIKLSRLRAMPWLPLLLE